MRRSWPRSRRDGGDLTAELCRWEARDQRALVRVFGEMVDRSGFDRTKRLEPTTVRSAGDVGRQAPYGMTSIGPSETTA